MSSGHEAEPIFHFRTRSEQAGSGRLVYWVCRSRGLQFMTQRPVIFTESADSADSISRRWG